MIAISYADRVDLTYGSDEEMEKAYRQYVSGWMFDTFGLRPAAGRLFTERDDLQPGAHPYAVLSHDYWTRRFGQRPEGDRPHLPHRQRRLSRSSAWPTAPFTGTETRHRDRYLRAHDDESQVTQSDWSWFRTLAVLKPGVAAEPVRARLHAIVARPSRKSGPKGFDRHDPADHRSLPQSELLLEPAPSGVSGMQKDYRRAAAGAGVSWSRWCC